ncbi:MAG: hypothetical protein HYS17_05535 [Micavibrio aeruginosavorus]|uniref:Uncharacterized protein n=1 Tax=Micavibrio aeruginosavorus TaxID=349221 RepID=A0A7T5R458_9BACT|nr:MAG: hypothetical protein HYS17_05535 [Micavibrio aeruginosavorus]
MDGTPSPFRRRAYANLCRDFIDSAAPLVSDVLTREYGATSWKAEKDNMLFAAKASAFFSEDTLLALLMLLVPFSFPKALIAARQDRIAIKFADNIAQRLLISDGYSTDHVRRKLPHDMVCPAALRYAEQKKLNGLGRLIERSLI